MNDYYLYDQLINRLLNSSDPVSKRDIADYLNVKVKTVKSGKIRMLAIMLTDRIDVQIRTGRMLANTAEILKYMA